LILRYLFNRKKNAKYIAVKSDLILLFFSGSAYNGDCESDTYLICVVFVIYKLES